MVDRRVVRGVVETLVQLGRRSYEVSEAGATGQSYLDTPLTLSYARYVVGLILGYSQYARIAPPPPLLIPYLVTHTFEQDGVMWAYDESPCPSLAVPTLTPLILCTAGTVVVMIAIAMLLTVVLNARRGASTVQVERIRRWHEQLDSILPAEYDARIRLWVPASGGDPGLVIHVNPDEPLYDFGFARNWRAIMGEHVWQWAVPWIHG